MASDRREEYVRSNPTRSAILDFFEGRPDAGPTNAAEVWGAAFRADAPSLSAVVYHLRVLADNGHLERDGSPAEPRFRLAS